MNRIPGKLAIRKAATKDLLLSFMVERELGFCEEDRTAYIRIGDSLEPLGGGRLDIPTTTSLLMGFEEDAETYTYDWKSLESLEPIPHNPLKLWSRLAGMGLYAEVAHMDSKGRDISEQLDYASVLIASYDDTTYAVIDSVISSGKLVILSIDLHTRFAYLQSKINSVYVFRSIIPEDNIYVDYTVTSDDVWSSNTGILKSDAVSIYPTLQDAVTDEARLSVGDIFETNGFYTSGDGGGARYAVSDSGTANGKNIVQLSVGKFAILQYIDFVKPEQYGAYGDNSTDDTDAFDAMFADGNAKTMVLSENKTYKVQFKNWTFSNRTFVGLNKDSSRISQASSNLNTPFLTPGTNCDIGNMTIICGGGNTTRTGLFHFGDNDSGVFTPYIGTRVHDIHAYCVANIIGVDISYTRSGSYNLKIEHCKFDNPGTGIRISMLGDTTHQSYISDFYFEDILVSGPYSYGLEMDKAQAGGMMISHGLISQFSVQLQRGGSCGFKLSYGDYVLINPTAFIENTSGEVYSVNLDFQKQYPGNLQNGIIACVGGILEGQIINKHFLNLVSWENTDFVEESDFNENTAGLRPVSRHLSTSPNSVFHKSAQQLQKNASLTNASLDLVTNDFGVAVKISVTDFSVSTSVVDIPFELPSSNYITIQALLLYSNNHQVNAASGGWPIISIVDSNGNTINDLFGLSLTNRYGRITMDAYKTYYGLSSRFDLTNADRSATWKIRIVLPTGFSDATENAFVSLLALNVFDWVAVLPNLSIACVRNKEWADKDTAVISQVIQGGTTGQWLTFTFSQLKFNSMAYLSFTAKNVAVNDDEVITIKIMSGDTVLREYQQILKAGLNTIEVSISTGGKSYTPKLSLTSPNQKFTSGTYTCYIQGVAL